MPPGQMARSWAALPLPDNARDASPECRIFTQRQQIHAVLLTAVMWQAKSSDSFGVWRRGGKGGGNAGGGQGLREEEPCKTHLLNVFAIISVLGDIVSASRAASLARTPSRASSHPFGGAREQ
jgi:hypothetical protein